ncbi:GNAT family N-acetyltransferase [Sphingomonas adhaesiva]|uniref:GNAT family N-acetyltransferase n=1 Tax=Sphingomonas adhaesiva TaxID=28212 RepID=UPI002FFCFDF6
MATGIQVKATLRRMTPADLPAAHDLSREVKWPHRIEDWEMMLALGEGQVAEIDDRIVGSALTWQFGADGDASRAATIGMVIVTPHAQGMGIGRRLMEALLERHPGRSVMLNATEEGLPLYEKLGFERLGTIVQHQGAAFRVPVAELIPGERVRPLGTKDDETLFALARAATGMDRRALLEAILPGAQGVMLTRENEPVGFALFRRFGRGYLIGPVVAPDVGGAKVLISHWLGSNAGAFCRMDVPETSGLAEWLEDLGLPQVGRVVTMVRGPAPATDPATRLFSLTTQALG